MRRLAYACVLVLHRPATPGEGCLAIILVFLSTPPGYASQALSLVQMKPSTRVFPGSMVGVMLALMDILVPQGPLRLWSTTTGQGSLRFILIWPHVQTSASGGLGFPEYGVKSGRTDGWIVRGPYRSWSGARHGFLRNVGHFVERWPP